MSETRLPEPAETPVVRLTAALNEVADALAAADLPRLLAAESGLGAALDGVVRSQPVDRHALDDARSALLRCRRLGAGLVAFTRLSLDPEGTKVYSRRGAPVDRRDESIDRPVRGGSMEARV
jgi:hypothetical protein